MGCGQQKHKQQQSQQIRGGIQQNPQQKQSQCGIIIAEKKAKIKPFDYEKFMSLQQQELQNQEEGQENCQQLLNQFKCMILNHNNKTIEGICVNEECKAQNRRTCFDCIIQRIHDNDRCTQCIQPLNADQINSLIKKYLFFLNQQIDHLLYRFYFEQLVLTNENDEKIACIKLQELEQIEIQIKQLDAIKDSITIKEYIQQQHNQNIGLFDFFSQYYQGVYRINKRLIEYAQFKDELKNSKNVNRNIQIKNYDIDGFDSFKKMKHNIFLKIKETLQYKNGDIEKQEQEFMQSLYNSQRHEEENQMYDKTIQLNPFSQAYYNKGLSLDNLQRYEEAIQMYDKAIQLNPQFSQAYYNKGVSLRNLQRYEEAIQMYDKAIQLNPQYSQAYYNKGVSLRNLQRYEEAIQMYDKAIQLNPQFSQAYYNKGSSLRNLQRYEEAIQMYDKVIQLNPQCSQAYYNKGVSLRNLQRYEEAIQMYDKAIQLNPQFSQAYYNKGVSLYKLQRYEEAIQMYDKAIQLNPQYSLAYYNKGVSLRNLQRYEEAIQMYDKAIQLNPQFSDAYNNKGSSLDNLQRYEEAIQMYDKAIQLNPQYSQAYNNKGLSLDNLQRYEEAIQMYDKAIQLNPQYSKAYNNKGFTLQNLQRYEEAQLMFKKAKEIENS